MRALPATILVGLAISGCRPEFPTLDAACDDRVPGQAGFDDGAEPLVAGRRINCHRRYVGMSQARLDAKLSAAARAHARYLAINGDDGQTGVGVEDPTREGYTGAYPWDRFGAQGYDADLNTADYYFWSLATPTVDDAEAEVDGWMDHYLTRQVLLQPAVEDSGWGRSGGMTVFESYAAFPAGERVQNPILYPRDGQEDVPVGIVNGFPGEPMLAGAVVGYPITITVGSDVPEGEIGRANPYGLVLLEHRILGPDDQPVEVYEIQPETTPAPMPFTIALVPEEPLEPDTTYRVYARVSWNAGIKEVRGAFTTSSEPMDVPGSTRRAAWQRDAFLMWGPGAW